MKDNTNLQVQAQKACIYTIRWNLSMLKYADIYKDNVKIYSIKPKLHKDLELNLLIGYIKNMLESTFKYKIEGNNSIMFEYHYKYIVNKLIPTLNEGMLLNSSVN